MSKAALSIMVYGVYMLVLSAILLLMPNVPLAIMGIPTTNEVWIRVIGVMAGAFGTMYIRAAQAEITEIFRWSIVSRTVLVVFFVLFVLAGLAPINLLLLAIPDIPFVLWTYYGLRSETSARTVPAH